MKKEIKIILVLLVVVIGYVYLMGGPIRAFERIQAGEYLSFKNNMSVGVKFTGKYDNPYYRGKLSQTQWEELCNKGYELKYGEDADIREQFNLYSTSSSGYYGAEKRKEFSMESYSHYIDRQ